ncbi:MAG: cobalt-precorrin 5A hydrolase, partial [Sulfolobaceae archaeon]
MLENMWRGVAIVAASDEGYKLGERILKLLKNKEIPVVLYKYKEADIEKIWNCFDVIIFIMALEGSVRTICKYAKAKHLDPPVIGIDDLGKYVIPVLGGHWGANEVTLEISELINATPIITTASELKSKPNVELIAKLTISKIENPENIVKINSAILKGERVCLKGIDIKVEGLEEYSEECKYVITTTSEENINNHDKVILKLKPLELAVGIGSKKSVDIEIVSEKIIKILERLKIRNRIRVVASVREEMKRIAEILNAKFKLVSFDEIRNFEHPCLTPPSNKLIELGIKGVAEISALLAGGSSSRLVFRKISIDNEVTLA